MSQEVSTNPRASKPLTNSTSTQPWSAEADADRLMDDLFSDIDRILDGGSKLPTDPVKPEYISLQPLVMPQLPMPPAAISAPEPEQEPILEPTEAMPVELVERREAAITNIAPAKKSGWFAEKLLLIGGITSLVVAMILVLASQHKITLPAWLNFSGSSSTQSGQLSPSDNQFVTYMLRSLQVIDHKSKTNQKTATTASANVAANQPPANLQANSTASIRPNPPQTVLERIYIPVYPPQAPLPQPTPQAARPSFQAVSPAAKPPVKAPAPVAKLSPPAQVARVTRTTTPAQVAPALPALPPPPPPSAVAPSVAVAASSATDAKHILVGLLELGDRSAALFDVGGTTQRIKIGEGIGASGWTLVSVANQEAVIRRNGEVRSVYVGQKF